MLAPNPQRPKAIAPKIALWSGVLAVVAVYLFATRPESLPDRQTSERTVPIEHVFRIVASENAIVRGLWTVDIVGAGLKSGLKFSEKWRQPNVDAGPLPALFLREAATALQKTRVPLGLFLGSDYPISASNLLTGAQAEHFKRVRATGNAEFFNAADIGRFTAMFSDVAVAPGCVSCHNEHPNSPKTDWKLNDVMGATTWSYPKDSVPIEEAVQIIAALRSSFATAYGSYLEKALAFENPPEIGERWPREGYFLPLRENFMREFERRSSAGTLGGLLNRIK